MSTPPFSDTARVRPGEELNAESLAAYLRGRFGEGALTVEQFPGGHSNLTYLIRMSGQEYVLRRAPFGPVPPKAHDMAREYHLLDKIPSAFRGSAGGLSAVRRFDGHRLALLRDGTASRDRDTRFRRRTARSRVRYAE